MKKLLRYLLFVSATVAAGSAMASAILFEGRGFRGEPFAVDGFVPDFRAYDFNDRAMSMVVEGAPVEVCEHVNFGGNCQVVNPGHYPELGVWSHTISSVRPAYRRYDRYSRRDYHGGYDQGRYPRDGYNAWGRDRGYEPRYRYGGY